MEHTDQNLLTEFEEPVFTYVGFWPRFGALFIDGLLLGVVNLLLQWLIPESKSILLLVIVGSIPIVYHLILEYNYGATLGKMALGIKIVSYELQAPSIIHIFFRNLIYSAIQAASIIIEIQSNSAVYETNQVGIDNPLEIFSSPQFLMTMIFGVSVIVIYIIELVFLLTDDKFRSLHDRIGRTYVVKKQY
jgi:uncharacterized RDD family membrane protein YckC